MVSVLYQHQRLCRFRKSRKTLQVDSLTQICGDRLSVGLVSAILLLQYSDIAYNLLYRPSVAAGQIFFEGIGKEPDIAFPLGRDS